ncbi:suppressor of fused domain protein [Mycolicibacterium brumae]|uniref:Suppressor of fused protein (SUFU) n=1 Tax=Mycolicibacterium brumae TaxID=85968 RepID=A0A2G5PBI4_9MYCO|nr:suppressor of fused domain protein [Mycolicibacterium brumae]MCV7192120.1 suppressor of fused domain protein [Mycolicibacterium brumae]PIB75420.1 Suppressor of fused protein (SUFU) [Mycolicibacterium brumae]RWA20785.1 hypothetical protein MBRU_03740 [Mycolicibacterium brumae DSM 44177]UWW07883.1 suppressor of fused domain protein [Mycolicibacterium brumae]
MDVLARVRAHLRAHFGQDPDQASVTFLGLEPIAIQRFGPDPENLLHYVSVGCSKYPMADPGAAVADSVRGPRAEVVVRLRAGVPTRGLARAVALLAATPAVEGVVLRSGALIDVGAALWESPPGSGVFSAFLLGPSDIGDLELDPPADPVVFLAATPITANEAAWVRLKGADALAEAWAQDEVDPTDPARPAWAP